MQNYIFLGLLVLLMLNLSSAFQDYNKPLIMAHKDGDIFDKENTLNAINKSLKYNPDIIEIDVRKSKDNVLFLYHGNVLEYLFSNFYFNKDFNDLQKNYSNLTTLNDAAKLINNKSTLFLHIFDKSITGKDLLNTLKDVNYKEIWVANFDLDYLIDLNIPKDWKKINNAPISFYSLNKKKILDSNINVIELNIWDFTGKNIKELRDKNIDIALAHTFLPKNYYLKKSKDNNALWIYDYNFVSLKK